jgi:hypothetical protein
LAGGKVAHLIQDYLLKFRGGLFLWHRTPITPSLDRTVSSAGSARFWRSPPPRTRFQRSRRTGPSVRQVIPTGPGQQGASSDVPFAGIHRRVCEIPPLGPLSSLRRARSRQKGNVRSSSRVPMELRQSPGQTARQLSTHRQLSEWILPPLCHRRG